MPRLSMWALRAALIYFLTGFTFGALMLINKGQPFWPQAWGLLPIHIEYLLVGWVVQFALGVAFWILPRLPGGSRGNETLALAAFLLLNTGVLFVTIQEFSLLFLPLGRGCELLASILFARHAWIRIKPLLTPKTAS